jgi:hypothetical protein
MDVVAVDKAAVSRVGVSQGEAVEVGMDVGVEGGVSN